MSLLRKFAYSVIMVFGSCFGKNSIESKPTENLVTQMSLYDFKMKSIDGKEIDFSIYKGKKVLIVNTASECGYTPQYEELQKLHQLHGSKVVVLGFPCNDFGAQEPGSLENIKSFCQKNYGVSFQLFEKVSVKGDKKTPLYEWLSSKSKNGWNDKEPSWNFCKYLIDENGKLQNLYPSGVSPMSKELLKAIGV
jgi:glutathione peroxidase